MSLPAESKWLALVGALYAKIAEENLCGLNLPELSPADIRLGVYCDKRQRLECMRWTASFLRDNHFIPQGQAEKLCDKIDEIAKGVKA